MCDTQAVGPQEILAPTTTSLVTDTRITSSCTSAGRSVRFPFSRYLKKTRISRTIRVSAGNGSYSFLQSAKWKETQRNVRQKGRRSIGEVQLMMMMVLLIIRPNVGLYGKKGSRHRDTDCSFGLMGDMREEGEDGEWQQINYHSITCKCGSRGGSRASDRRQNEKPEENRD